MAAGFRLHEKLEADTINLGGTRLCDILLMNDRTWPWVLLVPRREGIREIYELSKGDQQQLLEESSRLGEGMMNAFRGDKLNVAALGNLVPQLHLHHIVRHRDDPAWPGPVWGRQAAVAYGKSELDQCRALLAPVLAALTGDS
ncbi:Diadenosine tetraphosphate (Ap4A) hydrolase [Marinobacter daqiaonensis]|uniref:Diadenosine tetraphosphate (Ap4A) hydrolase n=1 Tax=Marinobacter daqiaonensis TaxID=650891 RepID=A0A1I6H1Q8_9GAMM|nr:HIT family protein [Marinobacter daqiaonensis]SFR48277.1 Diadenosine tetraphosphate (Ap4A) hydrolase [Marinobacter daqiaonensis]